MSKVMLKDVRLCFPHLWKPRESERGDPKYGAVFLFPPKSVAMKRLQAAVKEVANEQWGKRAAETLKQLAASDRICVKNGEAKAADYPEYAGMYYLNTSNTRKPLVIDGLRNPLEEDDGRPYAGCYVHAKVRIWAQDNEYGKRVNAVVLGVQMYRDGEHLGGETIASPEDFDILDDDGGDWDGEPVPEGGPPPKEYGGTDDDDVPF